jgi:putative tryptophan/tyrosine transport system substrate-binding protein
MRRRDLLALVGGATALWPIAGRAQQPKLPTIGVLVAGVPDPQPFLKAFREGLRDLGYVEGQNIRLNVRSAEGKAQRLPELATDLVRQGVDIIVGFQTPSVQAAKRATSEIPIVMAMVGAPVETGLIASLARPGGNITGSSSVAVDLTQKNLELLRELSPSLHRVALLLNAPDPFSKPYLEQNQVGAARLGLELRPLPLAGPEQLSAAFADLARERVDAVIVQPSLGATRSAELALAHRLLAISPSRPFVESGGLMSYSAVLSVLWRNAAVFVDKILKGAKPADLPVQEPTGFELVINLKTATALGLTVPPSLLARADEVIE